MRFISDGPSIPDELLLARDQGRVVFFCGAGVSRAKAELPDFFELAATVTQSLGVPTNDPAMKIIEEAKDIGNRTGVDGLISADRIFGLLERDFLSRDIQEAVAKALTSSKTVDLSAHQILLKLATTQEGLIRLVTTNFDRLFDNCRDVLPTFTPPMLPDPSRATHLNGVVYLHGKINSNGDGAEGDGFILSSSEFGRAYLSEAWATDFVRNILTKYSVVFVGYSADDPPMQYLLEALNRTSGPIEGVYAFQSGDESYAASRWRHKGVTAIPYDGKGGHSALWETLEAWATRANDPNTWVKKVIQRAKLGPEQLRPHERGQVAHVVSTIDGARKFAEEDSPPPSTWLCVFDPTRRFAKPGRRGKIFENGPYADPFDFYSIDSDPTPSKTDPENDYAKREIPNGVWDAFALNELDRAGLRDDNINELRGYWVQHSPPLVVRHSLIGSWISKVSHQPETVWWASRQISLHPSILEKIALRIERSKPKFPSAVSTAWKYLSDYWGDNSRGSRRDWHDLAAEMERDGWNELVLRRFSRLSRPTIDVQKNYWGGPVPEFKEPYRLDDLISLDVKYPNLPAKNTIPDEWIDRAVVVLRRNLEIALELEIEIGGYGLNYICPITPEDSPNISQFSRTSGLSGWLLYFISQFKRLIDVDLASAKIEFQRWPTSDTTIFARLRIWALGQNQIVSVDDFEAVIGELPDEVFWGERHSRDLLLSLSSRWSELGAEDRKALEKRILNGPERWQDEEEERYLKRKAWSSINRLHWLNNQGCTLQLDLDRITEELRRIIPEWAPGFADTAAESLEPRGGLIRTDTDHDLLLNEPLRSTLAAAENLSGRPGQEFVEYDPYAGLSETHPVRAFAVLRLEAKQGNLPGWAWSTFLNSKNRQNDSKRLIKLIGETLDRFSASQLAGVIRPVSHWIKEFAKHLATEHPALFARLIKKATDALALQTPESTTYISRSTETTDWVMEAINSPAGKIAEALGRDPQTDGLSLKQSFPKNWLGAVEGLLALPGDLRRNAIVIFAHNLSWFYAIDPDWTNTNLLSILDSKTKDDQEALWGGLFWGGKVEGQEFFDTLKPHLLKLAVSGDLERRGYVNSLAGFLSTAWALTDEKSGQRWITDQELRSVLLNSDDDFRTQFLWLQENRTPQDNETKATSLLKILRDVWPKQIGAKSATVSAQLCDIAFSEEQHFAEIADAVLPLLTKIDHEHLTLPNLRRSKDSIVDKNPGETLALLHAVLPDNVTAWPYGTDAILDRIGDASIALKNDERLIELKRKWDAR